MVDRHSSQDVCPWNRPFASEHREPAFAPREALAGRDARTLARTSWSRAAFAWQSRLGVPCA